MSSFNRTQVTEIQGLYGPLQILEGRIQIIWGLQQLQQGQWQTRSGKRLRVPFCGRLNKGPGPDFLEAVIELDGELRSGAVEIHLYREDWWRHGHQADTLYDQVVLHVVLFAGGMPRPIHTAAGNVPEEWIMGPWLREDLEAVLGGEPGLFGELAPELTEWMEADDPSNVRCRLRIGADRRWQLKESMTAGLMEQHGRDGALHRMLLYYLGYPLNRKPFLEMADRYPCACWQEEDILEVARAQWASAVRWNVGRPANRAGKRLAQYCLLNQSVPQWRELLLDPPAPLLACLEDCEAGVSSTELRRHWRLPWWRSWLAERVLGACFSRSLADRIWIDVFLPALVVTGKLSPVHGSTLWFHWVPGNFPEGYRQLLRGAGIHRDAGRVLANGWIQGLYWVDDQLRMERIRTAMGTATAPRRA